MCSEDVQESVELTQLKVLSEDPFNVKPPPSAVTSVGEATDPSSMFLSSTLMTVDEIVVVVPLTVRLPLMTALPPTVKLDEPPTRSRVLLIVVAPSTSRVPVISVLLLTFSVPRIDVLPVAAATVNLLELMVKLLDSSRVLPIVTAPSTFRVPST